MIVCLTGGIASGKSTVANLFRELGAYIIDWDVLAREVVRPHSKAWAAVVDCFGEDILNEDLTINRRKLGTVVFDDDRMRQKLEQITHPAVFDEDKRLTSEVMKLNPHTLIVKETPLLVKDRRFGDKIVAVYANEKTRMSRMMERGLGWEEAEKRLKADFPLDEKVRYADFVIYNDGSVEETKKQVESLYDLLTKSHR